MHVTGHRLLIAADIEMRAVLEPREEVARLLVHAVLDVSLGAGIAREGNVEAGKNAFVQPLLPFDLVEEIAAEIALAEEEPRFAGGCREPHAPEGRRETARRRCLGRP